MLSGKVKILDDTGQNNKISVGRRSSINRITVSGNNNRITIGRDCIFLGRIVIRADGCTLRLGNKVTARNLVISMQETGNITIGNDCMFSSQIHMDVSDMHSILDARTGKRINPAQDIVIGDHVWVGTRVFICKGSTIGSGSVIGAMALVTGTIPDNVLAAGNPAKVIREGVDWDRELL